MEPTQMNIPERRKFPRTKIYNLISLVCLDDEGRTTKTLMGIALNISQGGIVIETALPIEPGNIVLVTADEEEKIFELKAQSIYCNEVGPSKYWVGIKLQGATDENLRFIKSMVRAHYLSRTPTN
jgi:hypothetical protein